MLSKDVVSSTMQFGLIYETPEDTSYSRIVRLEAKRSAGCTPLNHSITGHRGQAVKTSMHLQMR